VSLDGQTWQTVASDEGREPWTHTHGIAKARRTCITDEDTARLAALDQQIAQTKAALNRVPPRVVEAREGSEKAEAWRVKLERLDAADAPGENGSCSSRGQQAPWPNGSVPIGIHATQSGRR
jgi:hypothetical protein